MVYEALSKSTEILADYVNTVDQKRERMKPLFIARAVSGGSGPIAKYLRKQRLAKGGQTMMRKKPVTRH